MSDSLRPHGLQPTRLFRPWDFPGKSTGVDCHFLLQRIFPTQGSNPGLLHCRQTLYHLSHQGSSKTPKMIAILFNRYLLRTYYVLNFSGGSDGKASAYNEVDPGSILGSGRSPGEGNGNPLQDSCLENPMDGEAWQVTVHGVAKSRTQLSDFTHTHAQ